MNKSELVAHIATSAGLTKAQAIWLRFKHLKQVSSTHWRTVAKSPSLGLAHSKSQTALRTGRNPKTGEEIQIVASKVPTFKAGKAFKEAVN